MKNKIFIFSLFIVITSLFVSCENSNENKIILDKDWIYSFDENFTTAKSLNVEDFRNLNGFFEDRQGYIYLKNTFTIPQYLENYSLGCYFGIIQVASEIKVNGHHIGESGQMPPFAHSQSSVSVGINLPSEFLNFNNEKNELSIKLYVDGYGQISEIPFISTEENINTLKNHTNFINSQIYLISSIILVLVSFMYYFLYFLKRDQKSYLSFASMNFFSSLYLINISFGEFAYLFPSNFSMLVFEKIFNCVIPTITAAFSVSFMRDFLGKKDSKRISIYRLILVFAGCLSCLFTTNMNSMLKMIALCYILIGVHIFHAVKLIMDSIFKDHNKNVYSLILGFSPVLLSLFIEIIVQVTKQHTYLFIIVLGWQFVIYTFIGILLIDFAKKSKELKQKTDELENKNKEIEDINFNLEAIVNERTSALKEINEELSFKQTQNDKEIELATYVQQSFYKHEAINLKDWEIGYYFEALQGVSGDLYDIYYSQDKLEGLGIFDVSGHGIASGLVTMLVKNIINQEFYIGSGDKLDDVMSIINNRIIDEKGNIENYLTGILIRVKGSNLEIVNAGHPECILFNKKKKKADFVSKGSDECCGAIGIPYLPVHFETEKVKMTSGDTLLLYTDGITESRNSKNEEYTSERLIRAFEGSTNLPVAEQVNAIHSDLKAFIGNTDISDDISFIILKKK